MRLRAGREGNGIGFRRGLGGGLRDANPKPPGGEEEVPAMLREVNVPVPSASVSPGMRRWLCRDWDLPDPGAGALGGPRIPLAVVPATEDTCPPPPPGF